jgi:hypothetical protein
MSIAGSDQESTVSVEDDLLYNGDENPRFLELAKAFERTKMRPWVSGVLPATDEELRLFFKDKDGAPRYGSISHN